MSLKSFLAMAALMSQSAYTNPGSSTKGLVSRGTTLEGKAITKRKKHNNAQKQSRRNNRKKK